MAGWVPAILAHRATLAAKACVIIGPTTITVLDLRTRVASEARTADGVCEPGAVSDLQAPLLSIARD